MKNIEWLEKYNPANRKLNIITGHGTWTCFAKESGLAEKYGKSDFSRTVTSYLQIGECRIFPTLLVQEGFAIVITEDGLMVHYPEKRNDPKLEYLEI